MFLSYVPHQTKPQPTFITDSSQTTASGPVAYNRSSHTPSSSLTTPTKDKTSTMGGWASSTPTTPTSNNSPSILSFVGAQQNREAKTKKQQVEVSSEVWGFQQPAHSPSSQPPDSIASTPSSSFSGSGSGSKPLPVPVVSVSSGSDYFRRPTSLQSAPDMFVDVTGPFTDSVTSSLSSLGPDSLEAGRMVAVDKVSGRSGFRASPTAGEGMFDADFSSFSNTYFTPSSSIFGTPSSSSHQNRERDQVKTFFETEAAMTPSACLPSTSTHAQAQDVSPTIGSLPQGATWGSTTIATTVAHVSNRDATTSIPQSQAAATANVGNSSSSSNLNFPLTMKKEGKSDSDELDVPFSLSHSLNPFGASSSGQPGSPWGGSENSSPNRA